MSGTHIRGVSRACTTRHCPAGSCNRVDRRGALARAPTASRQRSAAKEPAAAVEVPVLLVCRGGRSATACVQGSLWHSHTPYDQNCRLNFPPSDSAAVINRRDLMSFTCTRLGELALAPSADLAAIQRFHRSFTSSHSTPSSRPEVQMSRTFLCKNFVHYMPGILARSACLLRITEDLSPHCNRNLSHRSH